MEKVIGFASYDVIVECPECKHKFSAIENDDENTITKAMFKNTNDSCNDMDITLVCHECDSEFILDSLDY